MDLAQPKVLLMECTHQTILQLKKYKSVPFQQPSYGTVRRVNKKIRQEITQT